MKASNKILGFAGLMFVSSMAMSSEINVGGVTWDPDYTDGGIPTPTEQDFIGRFNFTQWFSTASDSAGSLNSFGTRAFLSSVLGSQAGGGSGATGYNLAGAGEFYQINDPLNDIVISSTTGGTLGSFCEGCELTFAFGNVGLNKDNTFNYSSAWARIYVDNTPDFSIPVVQTLTDPTPANDALGNLTWLDLTFDSFNFVSTTGTSTNAIGAGQVTAQLRVIGGAAAGNFDPKTIDYRASAYFGSSQTSIDPNSTLSNGGNGSILANTIPEPSSLALLGLGLLGFAAKRKTAA
jgi:hypothetical protein